MEIRKERFYGTEPAAVSPFKPHIRIVPSSLPLAPHSPDG